MKKRELGCYAVVAVSALMFHWLVLYLAWFVLLETGGTSDNFLTTVYNCLQEAGDIPHYVDIAKNGYHPAGENANNIVFFPLFPLLMKVFYFLFHDYVVAGVVISNICLVIGTVYFFRIILEEYDIEHAVWGVLFLSMFPVGFFMIGAYTESLFIMLTVMCLYYIRKKNWLLAGLIGMFASLSRSQGIALFVPMVYEVCLDLKNRESRKWQMAAVLLNPAGTVFYLVLNQVIYGKWNAFLEFQAAPPWYNTSHWISENLTSQYQMALDYPYLAVIIYWAQILLYFIGTMLLFYGLWNKVQTFYIVYGGAYICMTFLHGWMISGPRYMMSCVPLYIIMASHKNNGLKWTILLSFSILSTFFALWYLQGQAIM